MRPVSVCTEEGGRAFPEPTIGERAILGVSGNFMDIRTFLNLESEDHKTSPRKGCSSFLPSTPHSHITDRRRHVTIEWALQRQRHRREDPFSLSQGNSRSFRRSRRPWLFCCYLHVVLTNACALTCWFLCLSPPRHPPSPPPFPFSSFSTGKPPLHNPPQPPPPRTPTELTPLCENYPR